VDGRAKARERHIVLQLKSALSGARRANVTCLGARNRAFRRIALPKSVESSNLALGKAAIRWMSDSMNRTWSGCA
jgi:hypothetical protein